MAYNYLSTYRKFDFEVPTKEEKKRPCQLKLGENRNKRKYDDVINDIEYEEQNMMHILRDNDVYKNLMLFNKKEKIDETMFTPKIVYAGILSPTLPKGFRPIPDVEEDNLLLLSKLAEIDEITKLAEIISNLEKM
jgi:hypothetical protein